MVTQTTNTEAERRELRQVVKRLMRLTADVLTRKDRDTIRSMFVKASERVDVMRCKTDNFLSITHSVQVATIVADEIGLGRASIVSALLYENLVAGGIHIEEVEQLFGGQIKAICDGLYKVSELYERHVSIESENFRKLLFTFAEDVRVILIILSDRLNLMRHLKRYSEEEQISIGTEVGTFYAPMAHRMGLYSIKSEMEDLSMKFTNREVYLSVARKLNETKEKREAYIKSFISPLREVLDKTGLKYEMKGRTKTISSIYNKLKKSNVEFEQIYDLFAIRIIVDCDIKDEKAECWRIYSIVTDMYQPNPARLKDWISIPKGNGYESLHTTVLGPGKRWVEVQIRTKRMDEVAEKGFAAHWKYKGIKTEYNMELWLANIREVLENPELTNVDFIEDFKLNLYDKEVFVFTPKGDLRRLAKGATVLDFAFDIHTNVGRKCVGAIVNERNVPIRYVLQNGDQVEVLTNVNQEPKRDWLNIVVTSRAKLKLRQALKEQLYRQSEIGRELLDRRLKNWKLELNDAILNSLVKGFRYKDIHDFLCDVGNEKIPSSDIKEFVIDLIRKEDEVDKSVISAEHFHAGPKEDSACSDKNVLMLDKDLTNIEYSLAKCCQPIFGDPVFAFVSAMGGVKIHRCGCPNEMDMRKKFGYRILEARWTGTEGNLMPVTLRVTGTDDIGIVTNISQIISKDNNVKMRSITVNSTEGGFEGDVTVLVVSVDMLNAVVKKIKAIKGVYGVVRIS